MTSSDYPDMHRMNHVPNPLIPNPSQGSVPHAPPSDVNQNIMLDAAMVGAGRGIYDRMANPTPEDLKAGDSLRQLGRKHVEDVVGAFFNFLSENRDDVELSEFTDDRGHGWVLRIVRPEGAPIITPSTLTPDDPLSL